MKDVAVITNAKATLQDDGRIFVHLTGEVSDLSSRTLYASYNRYNDILRVEAWEDDTGKSKSKKKGPGKKSIFFEVPPGNPVTKMIIFSKEKEFIRSIE